MTINWAKIAADAAAAIQLAGQSVTLTYESSEVINPATGAVVTPHSDTAVTANGVLLNYNQREIDNENIRTGDFKLLIEDVTPAPAIGWIATVAGVKYKVVNVMPLQPGGTNLIYTLQVRK